MIDLFADRLAFVRSIVALLVLAGTVSANDPDIPRDTQKEAIPLTPPEEAAAAMQVPDGFRVELFAAEPDVRQPIALATDARGRLWVAENNTYAEREVNFDTTQRDRIVILEDTDRDGQADRRTVFWDQAEKLTSIEIGLGGVWALCPPQLLFLPDRNGDDVPDGEPVVLLDGFDHESVRHNIANGLRWGPDGWLYGRHGIQATSYVGKPGIPRDQRTPINCAIWRYHPTREVFEIVCQGTTNPWGMDWDEHGELFFINTVIGHLWHALPGAHFQRMYGEPFDPHLYELIDQTADHYHWDIAGESWNDIEPSRPSPSTDQAGGGHAHSGLLIYQGGNWPETYRNSVFAINLHGHRINRDTLERQGAGYVGRHAPDFARTNDPWFRAVELITGQDGGVYVADWTDIGECHENDGVHRSSGRIYKIVYGNKKFLPIPAWDNLENQPDNLLARLQMDRNEWTVRQARRVLRDRAADGQDMAAVHQELQRIYKGSDDPRHKLRALWALQVTGGTSETWLQEQLGQADEHVRTWAIRLLVDEGAPSAAVVRAFEALAAEDPSGLVLLYLASALQKLEPADRWPLAEALLKRSEFADDPVLPLMVWYGIGPAVPELPARAASLAASSQLPLVREHIARRLTVDLEAVPEPLSQLVEQAGRSLDSGGRRDVLAGMAEALRGRRRASAPASWGPLADTFAQDEDEEVRRLARELAVVFGDGRALEELFQLAKSSEADLDARRNALRVLVEARAEGLLPMLRDWLSHRDLAADAVRGLATIDDPSIPTLLLDRYGRLSPSAKAEAVVALSNRPASVRALLEAVADGTIGREQVSAFQVRQLLGSTDENVRQQAAELWPELRAIPAEKQARIDRLKDQLGPENRAPADLSRGRLLFDQTCASCHVLFGAGDPIGPDLTGAQRSDLGYLLENIIDPSASVAEEYRVSTVALADGRVFDGIVSDRSGATLTIQTPTERILVARDEVEAIRDSELSLMPEGQLDVLSPEEIRDLIAYLMSPRQVPRPEQTAQESSEK
ncbi:c-type cytochrome [soil metagenome]